MIIGISGKKRSGKDTVCQMMHDITGNDIHTMRAAFGDQIKSEVSDAMRVNVDALIEEDKERMRPLLQWWGTEFRRGYCGADYWINKMRVRANRVYHSEWLIITDVRFPDEAAMVKDMDGVMIRVDRETASDDQHPSETAMDEYARYDYRLTNNGTLEELSDAVVDMINDITRTETLPYWTKKTYNAGVEFRFNKDE